MQSLPRGARVDSKADIYALGLILNEMFTRTVPHGTGFQRISAVAPEFGYLDDLVEIMLRQDATNRPSVTEIKQQLIARGNEFVSLQKLSLLKAEVIPEDAIDDPLVLNPIVLTAVDYENNALLFTLSSVPTSDWVMAFQQPKAEWSSYLGSGPQYVTFHKSQARLPFSPDTGMQTQQLVTYMKSYIDLANRQYADEIRARQQRRQAQERERLRKQVENEELRRKVLSELGGVKL